MTNVSMKYKVGLVVGLLMIATLLIVQQVSSQSARLTAVTQGYLTEYELRSDGSPLYLSAETNNRIWFTMPDANVIGLLKIITVPSEYEVEYFTVPTANSEPHNLVVADGTVWFTEKSGNKLGKLDIATSSITEYPLPTADSQPTGLDIASDGNVWIATSGNDGVIEFDVATESFGDASLYSSSTTPANFERLEIANGDIWLTAPGRKSLMFFEPDRERFTPLGVTFIIQGQSSTSYTPDGMVLNRFNNPWVTASDGDLLGLYSPGTLALWNWQLPLNSDAGLSGLAYRYTNQTDQLWYAGRENNMVGRLVLKNGTPQSQFEIPLITADSQPHDVIVDSGLNAWISQPNTNRISVWQAPYMEQTFLPITVR